MAAVTVVVEIYPFDGVVGIQIEQHTPWGWVQVLDTDQVGTFPDYISSYAVTVSYVSNPLRIRWETSTNNYTDWFPPSVVNQTASTQQVQAVKQAIIQKATRFYMLARAPLGSWGEVSEFGVAVVRPDYETSELLYGMRFRGWSMDLTVAVTTAEVIRVGLQLDPTTFPAANLPDVQRAIDAAVSWVAHLMLEGAGIA